MQENQYRKCFLSPSLHSSLLFSSPHEKNKYQKNRRGKDIVKGSAVETLEKAGPHTGKSQKEVKAGAKLLGPEWVE